MEKQLKSRMVIDHEFSGCRYVGNSFEFNTWELTISLAAFKPDDESNIHYDLSTTFQKINMFLQCFMSDIFLVTSDDKHVVDALFGMDADNSVVIIPESPTDDVFVQALHAKLSAIAKDILYIGDVSLRSKQTKAMFVYRADGEYDLPPQEAFMGATAIYDKPWWHRYDCDTYDMTMPPDMTKEEVIAEIDTSKLFDELEQAIKEELADSELAPEVSPNQVIKMTDIQELWKPKEA